MPNGKKLPKDVVDQWPEVLKDVDVEVIPVEYLDSVRITFSDGKIWEIDTKKNDDDIDFEDAIEALLIEYEDTIDNVDFRLDTAKVKTDIIKRTRTFLKKRK